MTNRHQFAMACHVLNASFASTSLEALGFLLDGGNLA